MSESRTRTGRPALACDGRQHADGEHECARRFWSPKRDASSYPNGIAAGDLRIRARRQNWWCGGRAGELVDLCPYHAPAQAFVRVRDVTIEAEGDGAVAAVAEFIRRDAKLGSTTVTRPNSTGGLSSFTTRRYPGDDPSENG